MKVIIAIIMNNDNDKKWGSVFQQRKVLLE